METTTTTTSLFDVSAQEIAAPESMRHICAFEDPLAYYVPYRWPCGGAGSEAHDLACFPPLKCCGRRACADHYAINVYSECLLCSECIDQTVCKECAVERGYYKIRTCGCLVCPRHRTYANTACIHVQKSGTAARKWWWVGGKRRNGFVACELLASCQPCAPLL